jgi:hypothetical protein
MTEPGSSGSDSSSGSTGASSESGSGDDSSSGSTGEPGELCEDYTAHLIECLPDAADEEAEILADCTYGLEYYAGVSAECGASFEEFYTCLGTVDCEFYTEKAPACETEIAAFEEVCGIGKGGSTTVSDEGGEGGAAEDGG